MAGAISALDMNAIKLIAVLVVSALFASCNTMIGMGRDFKILGEGMENSANKVGGGEGSDSGGAPIY